MKIYDAIREMKENGKIIRRKSFSYYYVYYKYVEIDSIKLILTKLSSSFEEDKWKTGSLIVDTENLEKDWEIYTDGKGE